MMKTILMMTMLLMSTFIFAQKKPMDPQERAEKRTEKMKTDLALNDQQYAKVKTINTDFANQRAKLKEDATASKEDKRASMKKLRDDHEAQLKQTLTPEQWAKWQKMKEDKAKKKMKDAKKKDGKMKGGKDKHDHHEDDDDDDDDSK